jgi:hypothetical protein
LQFQLEEARNAFVKKRTEYFMTLPPPLPKKPAELKDYDPVTKKLKKKDLPPEKIAALDAMLASHNALMIQYGADLKVYKEKMTEKFNKEVKPLKIARLEMIKTLQALFEKHPFAKAFFPPQWNPVVMIDKDNKECNGLQDLGFRVILCNFHVIQLLSPRINSHCKDPDERAKLWAAVKQLQRVSKLEDLEEARKTCLKSLEEVCPSFAKYFKTFFACKRWIRALTDIDRRQDNEGFFNTNNFCEANIKKIGYSFFGARKVGLLFMLLKKFTQAIFPHFQDLLFTSNSADGPIHNPSLLSLQRRVVAAADLVKRNHISKAGHNHYICRSATNEKLKYTIKFETRCCDDEDADIPASGEEQELMGRWVCNCQFWIWYGKACKHTIGVQMAEGSDFFDRFIPTPRQPSLISSLNENNQEPLPKTNRNFSHQRRPRRDYNTRNLPDRPRTYTEADEADNTTSENTVVSLQAVPEETLCESDPGLDWSPKYTDFFFRRQLSAVLGGFCSLQYFCFDQR